MNTKNKSKSKKNTRLHALEWAWAHTSLRQKVSLIKAVRTLNGDTLADELLNGKGRLV